MYEKYSKHVLELYDLVREACSSREDASCKIGNTFIDRLLIYFCMVVSSRSEMEPMRVRG